MEFQTIFNENPSHHHLKPEPDAEIEDDFHIQNFHQLDKFSIMSPPFHPNYGMHDSTYDPFGQFTYGSASNDIEFKPFETENGCGMMQHYMGKHFVDVSELDHFVDLADSTQDVKPLVFVPDEGSCVTGENGTMTSNGNPCKGEKKTKISKGQWTKEEDRVLKQLVENHGGRKWSYIAQMMKGRIGKQCRERWHNHLKPNIKKDFWTEEEDEILITTHAQLGNKWSEIAKKLPGRTENSIKNHWNATKRRQYTKRKCRSKWPKPSTILQNYIKSLNLPRGKSSTNNNKADNHLTTVKPSLLLQDHYEYDSSDRLVPDFDFNEVPEFALDEKLLEGDTLESLLEEIPLIDSASGGSSGDMMEMITHVNF